MICVGVQVKDSDNETALEAILSLSQEEPEEESLKELGGMVGFLKFY